MIELRNLTKSYPSAHGRKYVFKDLNFKLPSGSGVGLIGRNGAGKSTLLNLLAGLDSPDRGEVITSESISWPVGLSGGFQGSLSARDNTRFVCRVFGASGPEKREKIEYVERFATSATTSTCRCARTRPACAHAWPSASAWPSTSTTT
jgi:capsular polysaccharide transport system ATP-binding protein